MPTDTPPRRNWHFNRWLIVLIVAMFGWSGWRAYAFRSALAEAKALGWTVEYTDPVETIRKNWKAAFRKATWLDGVTALGIPTSEVFEQNVAIVHRLNPKALLIKHAGRFRDLSALKPLTRLQALALYSCTGLTKLDSLKNLCSLQAVALIGCTGLTDANGLKRLSVLREVVLSGSTGLTNVDALKDLSALQSVHLYGCTGLTNVGALSNHSNLRWVELGGCTGLTKESVASLKAALPNTQIFGP